MKIISLMMTMNIDDTDNAGKELRDTGAQGQRWLDARGRWCGGQDRSGRGDRGGRRMNRAWRQRGGGGMALGDQRYKRHEMRVLSGGRRIGRDLRGWRGRQHDGLQLMIVQWRRCGVETA